MATLNMGHYEHGARFAQQAVAEDQKGSPMRAYDLYLKAVEHFVLALRGERPGALRRKQMREKSREYLSRAETLKRCFSKEKEMLGHLSTAPPTLSGATRSKPTKRGSGQSPVTAGGVKGASDDIDKLRKNLEACIVQPDGVTFDDVIGMDGVKATLKEATILPARFPQLFNDKRRPPSNILLYGPPGTGKTYLAKALAGEAGCTFINVSASDILHKHVGQSEKNVRALFELAKQHQPAIVFIDEFDSLATARSDTDSESIRRVKNELLIRLQDATDTLGVVVMGATNRPWELDPAVRRRFDKRVYIPLPNAEDRKALLKMNFAGESHELSESDFNALGRLTEHYSGSDLSVVSRDALLQPVREALKASTFKEVRQMDWSKPWDGWVKKVVPCDEDDPEGFKASLLDIEPEKVILRPVSRHDVDTSLKSISPSVSKTDVAQYDKYTEQYGETQRTLAPTPWEIPSTVRFLRSVAKRVRGGPKREKAVAS